METAPKFRLELLVGSVPFSGPADIFIVLFFLLFAALTGSPCIGRVYGSRVCRDEKTFAQGVRMLG